MGRTTNDTTDSADKTCFTKQSYFSKRYPVTWTCTSCDPPLWILSARVFETCTPGVEMLFHSLFVVKLVFLCRYRRCPLKLDTKSVYVYSRHIRGPHFLSLRVSVCNDPAYVMKDAETHKHTLTLESFLLLLLNTHCVWISAEILPSGARPAWNIS